MNKVKAQLAGGSLTYKENGESVFITKASGVVEIPVSVFDKNKDRFIGSVADTSKADIEKAVEEATKGLFSKADIEKAVEAIGKVNNKDNVVEALIAELEK